MLVFSVLYGAYFLVLWKKLLSLGASAIAGEKVPVDMFILDLRNYASQWRKN